MPNLSWNEIRQRAIEFSRAWTEATRERGEAQTFWNEFFQVFGIRRRQIASFEEPVRSLKNTYHYIDVFWKGRLLGEHKSTGEPMDKARSQAFQYVQDLASSGRTDEIPRYIILCDFRTIVLIDLEPEHPIDAQVEMSLDNLHNHVHRFAFLIGQKTHHFGEEDPANLAAAQLMADLHDTFAEGGYSNHALERLLVRLLFCLFADDTGIFSPVGHFQYFLEERTAEDGGDLGPKLSALFEVLNTRPEDRQANLDEDLAAFPYVNGQLFEEHLPFAAFTADMRRRLVAASRFDWSRISPAIFGSLFQGIMDAKERRQIGAHYTSERDIMKVIRPLFLDDLRAEFDRIAKDQRPGHRKHRLEAFRTKLRNLKFLDPACGCGNFLVVAYRELRRLEIEVLKLLYDFGQNGEELYLGEEGKMSVVDVDQFYGIEMGEWPVRIAETALWLTDHQMNVELSQEAGNLYQRIPLRASPHIHCANALRIDWEGVLPASECSYILGNPPFVGAKYQNSEQRADVKHVADGVKSHGLLDYVTMWYFRAAEYTQGTRVVCAFVSTNSISQGEQAGVLWAPLYNKGVKIHFAHRTFAWDSEAKGKAHVHVVIIGFGRFDREDKRIYEYPDYGPKPREVKVSLVSNISPYLVEAGDVALLNRSKPLCDVPEIGIGNKPIDGGHYLFTDEEKRAFLRKEPGAKKYFRPWIGSEEFINGYHRWCLWLGEASREELRNLPECQKRIDAVRDYRLDSKSAPTKKLAAKPTRFHVENFPKRQFLLVPRVSSSLRRYIPMGYIKPRTMASDACLLIPKAKLYHFGILTSEMHMAWVRQVGGRLKSDFRYSAKLIYNNFPWPKPTEKQQAKVEACAQAVLNVRQKWLDKGSTFDGMYDVLFMPHDLGDAHRSLNVAVDRCYRRERFEEDRDRVEYLFQLYEEYTTPLARTEAPKPKRRRRTR